VDGEPSAPSASRGIKAWYGFLVVLAALAYSYGLDSPHIPKNGDEYPYAHITRLTAASGRFLPLRSDLPAMRNTKPPLLFWQGILSTDHGRRWTLWRLRYPSVVYTLLSGLLVYLLGARLSGQPETGLLATLTFLAFFSTYRYGRPFLTSAPETFWLFLPFFGLLYWGEAAFRSRLASPVLMGLAAGMALLYKSFALALPLGLGLALWYLHARRGRLAEFLAKDLGKIAITLSLALALFGSWFWLDPDPGGVWREFVLGENVGKFELPGGYLPRLLWGTSSLWTFALGYPLNAGLLAPPVVCLFVVAWRRRGDLADGERLLWLWVLALFVFFSLPSQRSSRYLLAGMPALAVLLALNWHRIGRRTLGASLLALLAVVAAIAYLSIRLQLAMPDERLYGVAYWGLLASTEGLVLVALFAAPLARAVVHAGILLCYFCFAAFLGPMDGPRGRYDEAAQRSVRGRTVWVPVDFVAKEEGYRFLLPEADVRPYREERGLSPADAVARYPVAVVQVALRGAGAEGCRILGERLELRGRQTPREMAEILRGNIFEHLLVREWLVEASGSSAATPNAAPQGSR
jgi:4-amino-4-deoxy-L-arabinose transferase-like glycosyltransferase